MSASSFMPDAELETSWKLLGGHCRRRPASNYDSRHTPSRVIRILAFGELTVIKKERGALLNLTVTRAFPGERPVVERLLQLCLHDYTSHDPFAIGEDGLFEYKWTNLYWSSRHRAPYLFRFEGRLAGFAFVRGRDEGEPGDWDRQLAEFFVLRGVRRRKIGTRAALTLLRAEPVKWEFAYDVANGAAKVFWGRIAPASIRILRPIPVAPGGRFSGTHPLPLAIPYRFCTLLKRRGSG
jgi:predicted acetyltransferase